MTQNFKNHSRYYPLYHFLLLPLSLVLFGLSVYNLYKGEEDIYECALTFAFMVLTFMSRIYALRNQDRTIRLEVRQRYFELTGKRFAEKEAQLRMRQIIALRFASDAELAMLTDRAIAEKMSAKEIKQAIQNWQGDYYRV